jgi:hypothetical protein
MPAVLSNSDGIESRVNAASTIDALDDDFLHA